jgi:Fe-S oxidoreductase
VESSDTLQTVALVVAVAVTVTGVALFVATIARMVAVLGTGQADRSRTDAPGTRLVTTLREIVGHTRMLRRPLVGAAHWFVMVGFVALVGTLVTAYGQLIDPGFVLPAIGHFPPYEWVVEAIAWLTGIGILALVVVRQLQGPQARGRWSRFYRSTTWQAYYVEATILAIVVCVLALRALEYAYEAGSGAGTATALHYPLTAWLGETLTGLSLQTLGTAIVVVAAVKIVVSMAWFVVIGLTPTMGVAWHRFTAPFNVFLKRHADGRTSLGALQPIMVGGAPVDLENAEDLPEDAALGVGKAQDLTWKGLLDLTTCTECGRCQDQCPAWQTEKPLSPKLLITALRTRAYDDAPYLLAGEDAPERPLVGEVAGEGNHYVTHPLSAAGVHEDVLSSAALTDDVLWSCTTCGACVEQCPVDIEHVDHIVDMRRHQVLLEAAFPNELNGLFGNLEKRQNPWGVAAKARMDWAKGLPFPVPVVGGGGADDPEDLTGVDYLFWVGCAGAFEDRAKKTTRAVAELLDAAGVTFAVLGPGEACTGDPARRAGNEFLFQMLAAQNVETLTEVRATKVVVTCPHCFNTLSNEYPQLGTSLEVVHHTQLLNRLVRDKRLVPVSAPEVDRRDVTYHDPCYLGRHNGVYAPPRELIEASGTTLTEMPRNSETSFCCGAGGARMWMEEKLGTRINMNRTAEAVATGAGTIAVGCPFCRVMLSDGLTSMQSDQQAPEATEVLDVAQLLLEAVNRGRPTAEAPAHAEAADL